MARTASRLQIPHHVLHGIEPNDDIAGLLYVRRVEGLPWYMSPWSYFTSRSNKYHQYVTTYNILMILVRQ